MAMSESRAFKILWCFYSACHGHMRTSDGDCLLGHSDIIASWQVGRNEMRYVQKQKQGVNAKRRFVRSGRVFPQGELPRGGHIIVGATALANHTQTS